MITSTFHVSDMHCASCESRISAALATLPGIGNVRANPVRRELFIEHDDIQLPTLDLFSHIESLGFSPMLESSGSTANYRKDIKRVGVAAIGMMQVVMQAIALYVGEAQDMAVEHVRLLQLASFVFALPVVLYSAQPFYRNAWSSIRSVKRFKDFATRLSMDVPVALAISIAFCASVVTLVQQHGEVYFDSVVMFTFLLLTARLIGAGLSGKCKAVSVLALLPQNCTVAREGVDLEIPVEKLNVGDRVLVRPGERVVADGIITSGSAHLDESLLTGEVDLVIREPGEQVIAGTLNSFQSFEFEALLLKDDMRLAKIERLTAAASVKKTREIRRSNQIASYFVFAMLLVSALTAFFWYLYDSSQMLRATIAVLVVSCPCALALATPAAVSAALSRLQSIGVVISSGDVLETAASIKAVAFDKTGTLTTGQLTVERVETLGKWSAAECMKMAAGLERGSNHPIARVFHGSDYLDVSKLRNEPKGVAGMCSSGELRIGTLPFCSPGQAEKSGSSHHRTVWLSVNRSFAAKFELKEVVRPDVEATLSAFGEAGIELMLLSGDTENSCRAFESRLRVHSGLSPEQKRVYILKVSRDTGPVMMLGDGINDLPALASANLSAVVLEAPESVKSASSVLLLSRQLRPIYELLTTSQKARRIIRQNITWALIYNATMVPLAASANLIPWMAALGMSLSSLLVVMNSARLHARMV